MSADSSNASALTALGFGVFDRAPNSDAPAEAPQATDSFSCSNPGELAPNVEAAGWQRLTIDQRLRLASGEVDSDLVGTAGRLILDVPKIGRDDKFGMKYRFHRVLDNGAWRVDGDIVERGIGAPVGDVALSFSHPFDGRRLASFELIDIHYEPARRRGIGTGVVAILEDWASALGQDGILIRACRDDGPSVWGHLDFEWCAEPSARTVEEALRDGAEAGVFTVDEMSELTPLLRRFECEPFGSPRFPTTREVGDFVGLTKTVSSWDGWKPLDQRATTYKESDAN